MRKMTKFLKPLFMTNNKCYFVVAYVHESESIIKWYS